MTGYFMFNTRDVGESDDKFSPESPTRAEFLLLAHLVNQCLAINNCQYLLKMC